MATRTLLAMPVDTWVDLGAGLRTVTVQGVPPDSTGGVLIVNNHQDIDSGWQFEAIMTPKKTQIHNDTEADNVFVRATGAGWVIASDG